MKPREPRRKVLIDARLRHGGGWSDAHILNISARGIMVRAGRAPAQGSYVELSRGSHRIVARVIWTECDRFGARAQDAIAIEAIARGEEAPPLAPANLNNDRRVRREDARARQQERSRRLSRRLEFLAVTAFGGLAAFLAFDTVREVLSEPLNLVEATLAGGS